ISNSRSVKVFEGLRAMPLLHLLVSSPPDQCGCRAAIARSLFSPLSAGEGGFFPPHPRPPLPPGERENTTRRLFTVSIFIETPPTRRGERWGLTTGLAEKRLWLKKKT